MMEKTMSMQNVSSAGAAGDRLGKPAPGSAIGKTAQDAVSFVSGVAKDATEQVKVSASDAAASVTGQVKEMLDGQVGNGAQMAGHLASATKLAADDLQKNAPQLAGLVRGVAGRIEGFADDMRGQSVDSLVRSASDFTRQKPALVFGLAALAGFFVFRTLKAAPASQSTTGNIGASHSKSEKSQPAGARQFHGV